MHGPPPYHVAPEEPEEDFFQSIWQRGVRLATRLGISFGLSAILSVVVGAAATDNALAQILITAICLLAFWIPLFVLVASVERWWHRRAAVRPMKSAQPLAHENTSADRSWHRLARVAPHHGERIAVLRRSIDRSRLTLGEAELEPDAHDLCVLIDRRLPQLIDHELDDLPPGDRDRNQALSDLIALIEQFARECSRRGADNSEAAKRNAEVLRRRFEAHLSGL